MSGHRSPDIRLISLLAFLPFCLFALLPLVIERKSMYVNLAAHGFAKKGEVIASSFQDDEPLSRIADLETHPIQVKVIRPFLHILPSGS